MIPAPQSSGLDSLWLAPLPVGSRLLLVLLFLINRNRSRTELREVHIHTMVLSSLRERRQTNGVSDSSEAQCFSFSSRMCDAAVGMRRFSLALLNNTNAQITGLGFLFSIRVQQSGRCGGGGEMMMANLLNREGKTASGEENSRRIFG